MIKEVPYKIEHAYALGIDPYAMMLHDESMPAKTLILPDGKPICSFGVRIAHGGTGECWLITGEDFQKHSLSACKAIRKHLATCQEEYNISKLTATVDIDNDTHVKFIRWLGFTVTLGIFYAACSDEMFLVVMKP